MRCGTVSGPFRTVDELELATCTRRLHGRLGYVPPVEYYRSITIPQQPLSGKPTVH